MDGKVMPMTESSDALIPVSVIAKALGRDKSSLLKRLKASTYVLHYARAEQGQTVTCLTKSDADALARELSRASAVAATEWTPPDAH